jgi:hypothetical protein
LQSCRYRELYEILSADGVSRDGMSWEEVCEWALGEMEDLYSDRYF